MKILAIRGHNLASLGGPFEIDFSAPPLATAGLFAITGPTGAGKSTILDALCLALFNKLPRLPKTEGVTLGREGDPPELRISSNDVRGVLRRGAGSGWAEVLFEGRDHRRYRARWDVRRANNRPSGKLQKIQHSLQCLDDGHGLGGTATETLEEIERLLGLNFDQFRRAVLLAQGDFAAFLKAPAKDRSALLEQITGTEIYSRLSVAADGRAKAEKQKLALLEERCAAFTILDDAARAALEAAVAAAVADGAMAELTFAAAGVARDWHGRLAVLNRDLEAALVEKAAAEAAWQAAAAERGELEHVRRVQPLRPVQQANDRSHRDAESAADKVKKAEAQVAEAKTAHQDLVARREAAEKHYQACEAAGAALGPDLDRARQLDGELERLANELAGRASDREAATAHRNVESAALTARDQELATLAGEIAERQSALLARTPVLPIADEWPRWEGALERASAALAAVGESVARLSGLSGRGGPVGFDVDRSLAECDRELDIYLNKSREVAALPVKALESLRAERGRASAQQDRLRTLGGVVKDAARALVDRSEASADVARLGAAAVAEAAGEEAASVQLAQVRAALGQAEAALHRLQLARSGEVDALRASLVAGVPCPVCGGGDHPWAGRQSAAFEALEVEQRWCVDGLKADFHTLSILVGGHRAAQAAARRDGDRAEQRRLAAADGLTRLADTWRAAGAGAGVGAGVGAGMVLPADPASAAAAAVLAALTAETDGEIARIASDEAAAHSHQRELAAAEAAVAVARASRDLARVLAELERPFAGLGPWRAGWAADAAGFQTSLAGEVSAFQQGQRALAEAERRHGVLAVGRGGLVDRVDAAARAHDRSVTLATDAADRQNRCRQDRAGVLSGRSVKVVLDEATHRVREARREFDVATAAHDRCALALARHVQAHCSAVDDALARTAVAAGDRAKFDAALKSAGQDEAAVRRLLDYDQAWLEAAGRRLAALESALGTATATLAERQRLVAEHRCAVAAPAGTAQEARAALEAAETALGVARERLYACGVRVGKDDEARLGRTGLMGEIGAQRRVYEVWAGLDHVIGSASGDKFRKFAQGLSLDQLLGHANVQLADLARRYQLERAAGSDLEIQVADRDMGSEVRSIHSLSGGETFLISLALALGLSAMAGGCAGIGTLFIDEGFGALDSSSLDIALSCLEALQAGGRQVGVVSHVPAMIERIGVQVRVVVDGGGRSHVVTVGQI